MSNTIIYLLCQLPKNYIITLLFINNVIYVRASSSWVKMFYRQLKLKHIFVMKTIFPSLNIYSLSKVYLFDDIY